MTIRILLACFLLASAAPCTGQALASSQPIAGPAQTFHASYHWQSGALSVHRRTLTSVGALPVAGVSCFVNTVPSGFVGMVPQGEEWVDWGLASCDSTGIVRQLEIGYGTTALDTSLGGPGASLEIALYDGSDLGVLGTEVLRLPLTGLPASDGTSVAAFTMILTLAPDQVANAPVLTSEHVGYGYVSLDGLTGPLLIDVATSPYGPDSFGYEARFLPDAFDDIRVTGQDVLPLTGTLTGATVVPLGFAFDFYGQTLTEIKVSTDGYLTTTAGPDAAFAFPFDCFPSLDYGPSPIIAPMQTIFDMGVQPNASLTVETKGAAPFRTFLAQWTDATDFAFGSIVTFQVKLFESSNAIEFHYVFPFVNFVFGSAALQQSPMEALSIVCTQTSMTNVRFTRGRENQNGTRNLLGRYASPATPASFLENFVVLDALGNDAFRSSLHMRITEEDGSCGTAANTPRFAAANPAVFSSTTLPVLGTTWVGEVDTTPWPNATATSMSLGLGLGPCGLGGACPTAFGDLLLNPFALERTTLSIPVGGVGTHFAPIPLVPSYCGLTVHTQAVVLDPSSTPSLIFTNAIDLALGL